MADEKEAAGRAAAAGVASLRRSDLDGAREAFTQATTLDPKDQASWFGLALVHERAAEPDQMLAALDRALALDPNNLAALLMKADHFARLGEVRVAATFYRSVVSRAPPDASLPPHMRKEVARATAAAAHYSSDYERHLMTSLKASGFDPARSSNRFAQSIDLMLGKREVYYQQPTLYNFPGLPQRQFYERYEFDWMEGLEAATDVITRELLAVLEAEGAFTPYVVEDPKLPTFDFGGLLGNPAWSAYYLIENGLVVADHAAQCPQTMQALSSVPLGGIAGRTPSVLFSLLKPGTHIPPHCGMLNTRLICHLPLIVPGQGALRVGNEIRPWVRGETLIFDDSIEHEAWNRSDRLRVVLLFDVWRPELTLEERDLVTAMFAAVDAYGAAGVL